MIPGDDAPAADRLTAVDFSTFDRRCMRRALTLARRALGDTSPNPLVGAVITRGSRILAEGWHHRAGQPHAEIEALRQLAARGLSARGATLYVTLEPCCTHGRTPPCTDAILAAGFRRVVVAATDPNPRHAGRAFPLLRDAGITVDAGLLAEASATLNADFNHWITRGTPFVTLKAAMTLDGKIATPDGESKWITGPLARGAAMELRRAADAILVGVNTVLADDPALTIRRPGHAEAARRRFVFDSRARTPLNARLVNDGFADRTTVVVTAQAARKRVAALKRRVTVWEAPGTTAGRVDVAWFLRKLGEEKVTHLLVEGGGEVLGTFVDYRQVQRVAFFYAPMILGGRRARRGVAGEGAQRLADVLQLTDVRHRRLGPDLLLTARVVEHA